MDRASLTRRAGACAALCFALVASTVASTGSATAEDPGARLRRRAGELRASLKAIQGDLEKAVVEYNDARHAETIAVGEGFERAARADASAKAHAAAAEAAAVRIRALYMAGGQLAVVATVMAAPDLHDALSRYRNVSAVLGADHDRISDLTRAAEAAEEARQEQREAAHATIRAAARARTAATRVQELFARQTQLLDQADAELRAHVEAEAAKARAIAAEALARAQAAAAAAATATAGGVVMDGPAYAAPAGRYACPVGATRSFVDTWGAPRSGGRRHQGTDVFAPYGSPAYAVVDGVVDKWGNGGLGGITLWLRADNGDRFYYAHNTMNIATVGTRVQAGDVIARVGTTGNAATTPPHIHFEAHPGGGAARNPYPFLKAICG
ncbi:MAG TPA: M23 family metallopeptidase [Frankiaceae bacterium]|nr:M23 family metallopeptidase [Frankiaceae bacterium]